MHLLERKVMNVDDRGGMSAIANLVLAMDKKFGKKKTLEMIDENPNVFEELLSKENSKKALTELLNNLDSKNIQVFLEKLKLTSFQEAILEFIVKNNNTISLDSLEKEFLAIGTNIGTGSVIGGSIAGISKKCARLKIPLIIKITNGGKGKYTYSLLPDVFKHLRKQKNKSQTE